MRGARTPDRTAQAIFRGPGPNQAQIERPFKHTRAHPENGLRLAMRVSGMARPGLEPGTPRFSVVTSKRPAGAKSLETTRFRQNRCTAPMFGICGLFSAILGLTDTSGPRATARPRLATTGQSATRFAPDVGERGETGLGIAFGARSSGAMPAGLAWPACVSLGELRGHLRVRWYGTPGNVCIQGARERLVQAGSARSVAEAGKHPARIYAPAHRPERAPGGLHTRRPHPRRKRPFH